MAMAKASEVAQELRKLADALDQEPEQEMPEVTVDFYCKYLGDKGKPLFLALARLLPRPLAKGPQPYDADALQIIYKSSALIIKAEIERSKVCKLVAPAKTIPAVYDCEPLLSAEEEASLAPA